MTKSKVAIVRTSPRTVLADYHRVMNLAGYQDVIAKDADTALKVNISWHYFFPGSSTTPWQLEGVIRAMEQDGYSTDLIHACHNRTVVIDAHLGEAENKQINVVEAHGLRNVHLYEGEEWISVRDAVGDLTDKFLVLNEVYPDGFYIPKRFIGENIIHLPTIKCHIFTTTTGAMKNAFGGLLNERRHWTHPVIHETLVDLLMIQKKIHRGVFAVMDGTFAGDGPGPRCMIPHVKNVLLASNDQVAIDAMAAKLMGFNPLDIGSLQLAVACLERLVAHDVIACLLVRCGVIAQLGELAVELGKRLLGFNRVVMRSQPRFDLFQSGLSCRQFNLGALRRSQLGFDLGLLALPVALLTQRLLHFSQFGLCGLLFHLNLAQPGSILPMRVAEHVPLLLKISQNTALFVGSERAAADRAGGFGLGQQVEPLLDFVHLPLQTSIFRL